MEDRWGEKRWTSVTALFPDDMICKLSVACKAAPNGWECKRIWDAAFTLCHLIEWIRNYTIHPFSPALICTSTILSLFINFFFPAHCFFSPPSANLSICLISYLTISYLFFFFFWRLLLLNLVLFTLIPFFSLLSEIGNRAAGNWRSLSLSGPSGFAMLFHHSSSVWVFSARWPILASLFLFAFFPINSVSLFEIGFSFKRAKRIVFMPPSPSIAHDSSPLFILCLVLVL